MASPVFKLVSPDDTGGSLEVIIKSKLVTRTLSNGLRVMTRQEMIGPEGSPTSIVNEVEPDRVYRGSYNYAETAVSGFALHEYCDVLPHSERKDFYVNPDEALPFESRRFPSLKPPSRVVDPKLA
jgi:hypothetical protein